MYFTDTPSLNSMEAIMQKAPHLTQRGGGRNRSHYRYTAKDCNCGICLYYKKKKGCTISVCPVLSIRLECSAATFYEAVAATFWKTDHTAFRRRLDQYMKKEGDSMIYSSDHHKCRFESERLNLRKSDGKRLAILYLLTADDVLWRKVENALKNGRIDFPSVHLGTVSTDSYALWKAVKEIQTGKKQISLCELARKEDVSDNAFRLIVQAIPIARFGKSVLNGTEAN